MAYFFAPQWNWKNRSKRNEIKSSTLFISRSLGKQDKRNEIDFLMDDLLGSIKYSNDLNKEMPIEVYKKFTSTFDLLSPCAKLKFSEEYLTKYYLKTDEYQDYGIAIYIIYSLEEITKTKSSMVQNTIGEMYLNPHMEIPKDLKIWRKKLNCI
ncbi:MAG: hypothetical protein ACJAWV_001605 [Flammeovirgaceae bacterium]|jgi:hypothetical protein